MALKLRVLLEKLDRFMVKNSINALFLSGIRWASLLTLIDIGFTLFATSLLYFPSSSFEEIQFIVHRAWAALHFPIADFAVGLLTDIEPNETAVLKAQPFEMLYLAVCVAQTFVIGLVVGIVFAFFYQVPSNTGDRSK